VIHRGVIGDEECTCEREHGAGVLRGQLSQYGPESNHEVDDERFETESAR